MDEIKRITEKINNADAILIGASNGLSITEGLNLFADDAEFEVLFGDFKKKYGIKCILQGMGARLPEEEKWAFWSRLIADNIKEKSFGLDGTLEEKLKELQVALEM